MHEIDVAPDRRRITEIQSQRLAALSGLNARELAGGTIAEIGEKFRWRIDPQLLLFRRVCGRVVKHDPISGVDYPVPFATVHVEDTDCGLLGYFPSGWLWGWFFPLFCRREEIATVQTDACGNFCVWVPRWDIDWILHFRRQRICFPIIFERPTIRHLLEDLQLEPRVRPRIPEPDPPPFVLKDGGMTLRRAGELLGPQRLRQLVALEATNILGSDRQEHLQLLDRPAFTQPLPPPLSDELKQAVDSPSVQKQRARMSAVATRFKLEPGLVERLDLRQFIGPFRRCFDVFVPEWQPILDVPDITFRVTQDVDGDGDEETIYSEGFFDVRWDAGAIPDVTLYASPIALAGLTRDAPEVPCGTTPAILFAGQQPLFNPASPAEPYHDAGPAEPATIAPGYARRSNRPHLLGVSGEPPPHPRAKSPYAGALLLFGCNQIKGASHYRLRYAFNGGSLTPFTGLTWPLYRMSGGSLQSLWPTSDAFGWYPVLPAADNWFPQNLLLTWPTSVAGLYTVQLELGNGDGVTVLSTSTPINLRIDNAAPTAHFTDLAWRVVGAGAWTPLELICPVVVRPTIAGTPVAIEFRVGYQVLASHLRSVLLSGGGCGDGLQPEPLASPNWSDPPSAINPYDHWHTDPDLDNSVARRAVFRLDGAASQGAYSFSLYAASRALNPSDPTGFLADWEYNPAPIHVVPSLPVAIVNA